MLAVKTVYHGTRAEFQTSIIKGGIVKSGGCVSVTEDRLVAEFFAHLRSRGATGVVLTIQLPDFVETSKDESMLGFDAWTLPFVKPEWITCVEEINA